MRELGEGKRIVFTTWGSYGDLHPYMALALELRARGHRPVLATSPYYRDKIEAAGLDFAPVRPDIPSPDTAEASEMIRRAVDQQQGPRYVIRDLVAAHTRETYFDTLDAVTKHGQADLLVSHTVPFAAPLIAEKTGLPWISTVLAPIPFVSAYDPPSPPQFPALRPLLALHPIIARAAIGIGQLSTDSWFAPVRQLRRELGLPPGRNPVFAGQHSPTRVLALFSPLFAQAQPDFPPHTSITGFPFYDRKDEQSPSTDLQRFLEAGEPPLLFTLGSSAVWIGKDFFRTSIEAARTLKRRALLLIGDERNLPSTGLPEGIAAFDYAPHSLVMPRASVIVHPGGIGTTGQALRSGRPMLVVPFGQDQPDNARRCVKLGVARTLALNRYTVARVVAELHELLANPAYSRRATEVGKQVQAEGGTPRACDAIEETLNQNNHVASRPAR